MATSWAVSRGRREGIQIDEASVSGIASGRRPGLAVFAAINALAAWGGAVGLIMDILDLGGMEDRLPFESTVLGGVALAIVVACPLTLLAWSAWTGSDATGTVTLVTGMLIIGWIVVQILILRTFSPFQPAYLIVGGILVAVSGRVGPGRRRDTR